MSPPCLLNMVTSGYKPPMGDNTMTSASSLIEYRSLISLKNKVTIDKGCSCSQANLYSVLKQRKVSVTV